MILVDTNIVLLAFNDADFKRFTEISAMNSFEVLGIPRVA